MFFVLSFFLFVFLFLFDEHTQSLLFQHLDSSASLVFLCLQVDFSCTGLQLLTVNDIATCIRWLKLRALKRVISSYFSVTSEEFVCSSGVPFHRKFMQSFFFGLGGSAVTVSGAGRN